MPDPLHQLARLLRVKGETDDEAAIVAEAAALCSELGFDPEVSEHGVIVRLAGETSLPTVLFVSHLDTVPAGSGWSRPPHAGVIEGDWLYGRGAVDARGSCLAMLLALTNLAQDERRRGTAIVALAIGEEGDDPSLPRLLDRIGTVDAGIVGEPTGMRVAVAQRGLLILELTAHGAQEHAARAQGVNAIRALTRDLMAIEVLELSRRHPSLGAVRVTPTRLNAGVADNVTPPCASAILDVRTIPSYENAELLALLSASVKGEIRVVADAWIPCETPEHNPLRDAAGRALADAGFFASDAASDWAFLERRGVPAIKVGPGSMAFSHRPDERISRVELLQGIEGYTNIARALWTTAGEPDPKA